MCVGTCRTTYLIIWSLSLFWRGDCSAAAGRCSGHEDDANL